jgi:hypothetical protein
MIKSGQVCLPFYTLKKLLSRPDGELNCASLCSFSCKRVCFEMFFRDSREHLYPQPRVSVRCCLLLDSDTAATIVENRKTTAFLNQEADMNALLV